MFGFRKEKKDMSEFRLTREEQDVLNTVYNLVCEGRIPFSELKPIIDNSSNMVEAHIKEQYKKRYQYEIECLKSTTESRKRDIECLKQKLDKYSSNMVELKAELEDQKKRDILERDENRIKDLLYWIFNIENESESLRDEIKTKEVQLKVAEDELANKEEDR